MLAPRGVEYSHLQACQGCPLRYLVTAKNKERYKLSLRHRLSMAISCLLLLFAVLSVFIINPIISQLSSNDIFNITSIQLPEKDYHLQILD
jgi:hypothetical protein